MMVTVLISLPVNSVNLKRCGIMMVGVSPSYAGGHPAPDRTVTAGLSNEKEKNQIWIQNNINFSRSNYN
jgi:hypothetical protein